MRKKKQLEVLGRAAREDGSLGSYGWHLSWRPGDETAELDGDFTADELEAIAKWMREHGGKDG